jgi:hypothetical protein
MGGKKSHDGESDKSHEGAKTDHKNIEHSHDAPQGRVDHTAESQAEI